MRASEHLFEGEVKEAATRCPTIVEIRGRQKREGAKLSKPTKSRSELAGM